MVGSCSFPINERYINNHFTKMINITTFVFNACNDMKKKIIYGVFV